MLFALSGDSVWRHMFWPPEGFFESLPTLYRWTLFVAEKSARSAAVYLALVVLLRVFGKRVLAQITPFDLVVYLSLANALQNAIIGTDDSVIGGVIGALALLVINSLMVRLIFKHRRLDQFFADKPTVLIENGLLLPDNLAKEHVTRADMEVVAHRQGFKSLQEIDYCELDPGGSFLMSGKKEEQTDIISRLDELSRQLKELKAALGTG